MACYHPRDMFEAFDGSYHFGSPVGGPSFCRRLLKVPCQQCIGCRLEYSRQWAVRCMHEKRLHEESSYITLTFKDDPEGMSLSYRPFQLFMKRLRKKFDYKKIRFYMCGEYGEENGRPHYHALLFGCDFPDKYYWSRSPAGDKLYRSPILESIWTDGSSLIGAVSFESAAYVARYITKKITGDMAKRHYEHIDEDGVITDRMPEFTKMSLKPGIGAGFYDKFYSDMFPHGHVIVRAQKAAPPRYYKKKFEKDDPEGYVVLQDKLQAIAIRRAADSTPERLRVREAVATANLNRFRRVV